MVLVMLKRVKLKNAKDLVGEGLYNVWNKGPKQTLKMITSHFGSYNARAGK